VFKLILAIAVGIVLGNVLWEVLLLVANWAGQVFVKAFAGMLRIVFQAKGTEIVKHEAKE
jgi:hypothetical protein